MAAQPRWSQHDLWDLFDLSPVSDTDISKYLDITLAKCVDWFRASGGSFFLEDGSGVYSLRAKYGEQIRLPEDAVVTPGIGIAGIVVESGVARLIDDPYMHPDMGQVSGNAEIASSMVIPLTDPRRHVIGVLNISRQAGEQGFRGVDLDQAVALAAHVALAVGNAELVNRLKSSLDHTAVVNEQLVAVLDSVGGAVWVVDSEGRVVNANFPAVSLSGQHAGEQISKAWPKMIDEALVQRESVRDRVYDSRSDRTWLMRATPLDSGGAVVAAQEITDHERQQREFGRVKRLAEIGQMTAAIAHEIRNPLTGIRSAAQMIREHPDMLGDFIGLIEEEAMKLNELCDEFLEFARPMQLNISSQRLEDTIGNVINVLSAVAKDLNVELELKILEQGESIDFDNRRIGQVVHNLVRNAIEVTESGKKVVIEVESGVFRVRDWGPGMEQEVIEKLFSPFFTTKANGTGLGLCNCRKIVDAHGGELSVQSEVGEGTTFTVQLNREQA